MTRPGITTILEKNSPPMWFYAGDRFHYERLPEGTRVIYPPGPLEPLAEPGVAIERALLEPMGMEPLHELLTPGMKLTIAFDDLSIPLPPMRKPDIRQQVIEKVLEKAAARGVEDIHLIAALGLHRRMTEAELEHCLGGRIMSRYYPERLYNYDAEDPDGNVIIGETDQGEEVSVSRRVAESDLLVYVNVNFIPMDGGHKSVHTGLAPYSSIRHHHTPKTLANTRSLMDPPKSAMHASINRMGRIFDERVKVFHIESTLNNQTYPAAFDFMAKPEYQWGMLTKANFLATHGATQTMPLEAARRISHSINAPHRVTSVQAGATEPVHASTLKDNYRQMVVPAEGQSDVLLIGTHPMPAVFNKLHHPSYIDLWNEVFPETNDVHEIHHRYEEKYANDPWYRTLYRNSYAYHGAHPFTVLYWAAHALDHLGGVILVGGDPENTKRMGLRRADTVTDAFQMAQDIVGPNPSTAYMHIPPLFMCEVS